MAYLYESTPNRRRSKRSGKASRKSSKSGRGSRMRDAIAYEYESKRGGGKGKKRSSARPKRGGHYRKMDERLDEERPDIRRAKGRPSFSAHPTWSGSKLPSSVKDFHLFSDMKGVPLAAGRLALAVKRAAAAVKEGASVQSAFKRHVGPAMSRDAKFGAADSEPHSVVLSALRGVQAGKVKLSSKSQGKASKSQTKPHKSKGTTCVPRSSFDNLLELTKLDGAMTKADLTHIVKQIRGVLTRLK